MDFSTKEHVSGFSSLCRIINANKDAKIKLEFSEGDIIIVHLDCIFDDDLSSTDDDFRENEEFTTISFIIDEVIENKTNRYKEGHVVLVNHRLMPKAFTLI